METGTCRRSAKFPALAAVVILTLAAGCSTAAPALVGPPRGDAVARTKVKKLAIAGFLVNYDFGPNTDLTTVFAPGTDYQATVESAFADFADELARSPHFSLVAPETVKASSFYREMKTEPDPRSRLRSTCPAGYRKLEPSDRYDYEGLSEALGADGLIFFEFAYRTRSSAFRREAWLHGANILALAADGTILYQREGFRQGSGGKYFGEYAWLRRKTVAQDQYCLGAALRAVARDLAATFAPR
jgi:hypothetical protein